LRMTPACLSISAKLGKPLTRGRRAAARVIASFKLSIVLLNRSLLFSWKIVDAVIGCHLCEQIPKIALFRWIQASEEIRVIRIRNGCEDRKAACSSRSLEGAGRS